MLEFYYILVIMLIPSFLFSLFHAMLRIESPDERLKWLSILLFFNVFGGVVYLLTKHRQFRRLGLGGLGRTKGYQPDKKGQP